MRVLQLSTCFDAGGGIQTHVSDLSAWLLSRGHYVSMAGRPGELANPKIYPDFCPIRFDRVSGEDASGISNNIFTRIFYVFRSTLQLRRAIKKQKIQIIHAHETASALVAGIATIGLKIPILMTYHGSEPELVPQVGLIARYSADITISPSHATTRALQQRGGVPKHRTRVIGLGVNPLPLADPQEIQKFRADYVNEKGEILVCSLSRLSPQKGIDIMIEVVRRVVSIRRDVKFIVAGGGPLSGQVEEWARAAGLSDYIHFIGHTDNSALLLRASDIYLLTSRWEALPISIVEAFRAGLPVIATDCGGVRELVADNVGRLCAVEDVEALSEAILELAADQDLRRQLSESALALSYEDRFTPEHVNRTFEAIYAEVIGNDIQSVN